MSITFIKTKEETSNIRFEGSFKVNRYQGMSKTHQMVDYLALAQPV